MEQKELDEILRKHKLWLEGSPEGVRANLQDSDIRHSNLQDCNLQDSDIRHSNLQDSDIRYSNLQGSNLQDCNLQGSSLKGSNLKGANLDYSCIPLWCGGLDVHFDDRQIIQQLYHLVRNALYSENVSDDIKATLSTDKLINLANKFHRVDECGKITKEE